ncbi:MAG TPA: glycosyltransferase [Actinomycetota bacterium]|nr:glycosyltransferase [Actinomycetota bacterium]
MLTLARVAARFPDGLPARVLDIEIGEPLAPVEGTRAGGGDPYVAALVLVRLHGWPIGTIALDLTAGAVSPGDLAATVWAQLAHAVLAHLAADHLPPVEQLDARGIPWRAPSAGRGLAPCQQADETAFPFASVVIATHERPDGLAECVDSVLAAEYPSLEVLVVDTTPLTAATRGLIESRYAGDERVRYLVEPGPGASAGRNRGLKEARGEVVAFLDDDVRVDRLWLRSLVLGFQAAPGVACVTGMILPAELDTPAQKWIEEFGGFDKGYQRQIFDLEENAPADPLYPYAVGRFGSGACAAFDPVVLRLLGGFDTALGPATPARGGEDIDAFLRIVLAGHRLVYEPRSLVRHHHRRDYADLRRTVQSYGVGLSAVLTKALLNPATRADVLRRAPRGVVYFFNPSSAKNERKTASFPWELTLMEWSGAVLGPLYYLRSRRWARSAAPRHRAS